MRAWIVLPYDASPVARASLKRAAHAVMQDGFSGSYAGVMLATAGVDPSELDGMVHEAQAVAGPDVPLELHLLDPGDPVGDLHRLANSIPHSILAAPLQGKGRAAWYADACKVGGEPHTLMLFMIGERELQQFEENSNERHRLGGPAGALLRAFTRVRAGVRAPVAGGSA